jgi:hypothetical protein
LAEETKVLGENLSQRHIGHHKSHMTGLGCEPGPPRWESSDKPFELWRDHYLFLTEEGGRIFHLLGAIFRPVPTLGVSLGMLEAIPEYAFDMP